MNSRIKHVLPQCCFISPKCLNFLSHCKQLNGSSSVWFLSCSFKSLPSANFLSHFVQLNGLRTWLLLCCFNSSNSENLLSHCRHLKGSAPWVLSCSFKSWGSGNFLTHFEQLYGCSAGLCVFALVKEEMVAVVLSRMSHNLWCSNAKHGLRNAKNHWILHTKSFDFTLKSQFPQKICVIFLKSRIFSKKVVSYNQFLL